MATVYCISHLAKITSSYEYRRAYDAVSTAIFKVRGSESLQSYWFDIVNLHHGNFLSFFSWAERNGELELLFQCCHIYLEFRFNKPPQTIDPKFESRKSFGHLLRLCKAFFRKEDYISVIMIIEQLLHSIGIFAGDGR
jgi:hypothetical protein